MGISMHMHEYEAYISAGVMNTPCASLHVRRAGRRLSQMYDQYLRPAGIRSTQYGMLRCVEGLPETFISDIGRVLGMDQTTVTRNVEKLEKAGFVASRPHPGDPRKKVVELTDKGKNKLEEAQPLWEEAQARIVSRMGDEKLGLLVQLLGEVTEAAHTG